MKLFYHTYGDGPPLIILHGLFGISDNWVSVGRKLGRFYKVYVPDLRNHGQSPHSPVFDFPAMEDDLLEFIESQDLETVMLMGHSLGGKIAMMFTLHQPQRVEKLIVVDISMRRYRHNREHQSLIDAMLSVDLLKVKTRSEVDDHLKRFLPSERLRQFALKNLYWRDKEHLAWRLNLNTINQNLHAVFEGVEISGLYTGHTLFIKGGNSSYISEEDIIEIKKKFPGALVRTITTATHWVHADAPGEFYEMVEQFLRTGQ
jgi:pimeloyl-ACP methyl ester carboxylesterase